MQSETFEITNAQISTYKNIRKILTDLYPKFLSGIDKPAAERSARRLEIYDSGSLLLNTEHEMRVFYDYCLYHYKMFGTTIMERSFNTYAKQCSGLVLDVFTKAKNGYFTYLNIISALNDSGLVVCDLLSNEKLLLIDSGLNKTAKKEGEYTIVTNVIKFDDFIITSGASTPVNINSEEGCKIHLRFKKFLNLYQNSKASNKDKAQYITDMYKILINESITGAVESASLPFGKEALKERIFK